MAVELLPCPFCGEQPIVENWTLGCNNQECGVAVEAIGRDHETRAKQWNTRHAADAKGGAA